MWIPLLILAVVVGVALAGYESAPYRVVRSDGKFELRDYPALTVVETPMANPNGSDGSFMRLLRFITGANEGKQKIAMTTPGFTAPMAKQLGCDAGQEMPVVKWWLPAGALTQMPSSRSLTSGASISVGTGAAWTWSSTGARLTAVMRCSAWCAMTHCKARASGALSAILQWQHSRPRMTATWLL
ncbi:MAG: hypothetical protein CK546_07975 [Pedosphaera sp.]|nr:MAG: hypothetical protein CK546_07975 [Pedosphaera sp.]